MEDEEWVETFKRIAMMLCIWLSVLFAFMLCPLFLVSFIAAAWLYHDLDHGQGGGPMGEYP